MQAVFGLARLGCGLSDIMTGLTPPGASPFARPAPPAKSLIFRGTEAENGHRVCGLTAELAAGLTGERTDCVGVSWRREATP